MQDYDIEASGPPGPAGPIGALTDGDKGDVVLSGGGVVWTIDANAVDNSKLGDMVQATFKMRAAGAGTGDPIDGTAAQAKTALAIVAGDVSGLSTFATGTDAANLTGTIAAARLPLDTDTTLAANSDIKIATQKAVKAYVDQSVAGLLDLKGSQDCSANPNYPSAVKGDAYYASAAGKIGGASGKSVDVGDVFVASADNAGGTEASVGSSWFVLEHNLSGALVASNNLSELTNAAAARSNLGLTYFATGTDAANLTGTVAAGRLPQFTGGDVTTGGVGSVNLTIANDAVSFAKMLNSSAASVIVGRGAGSGAGDFQELTLGANLALTGTVLAVTAAGSDRQVQYNNGGAPAGAGGIDIDVDGDLRVDATSGTTAPGADQMKVAPQKLATGGGRVWPRWRGEDGIYITPQSHLGRNSVAWAQSIGSSATNPVFSGMTALNQLGTLANRAVASTSRATRSKRTGYVTTSAAAGLTCGLYNAAPNNQYSVGGASGGGFLACFRFVPSDPATVAGAHMFVGMTSQTASPTAATNPNTFTNSIGLAQCNGSANLQIVYGGSAAQTVIDLGANFPAGGLSTDLYELILYARPDDATKVAYRVERINTGDVASGVLTGTAGTAIPANTTFMGPRCYRSNNATALAAGFDFIGFEIESDI